jgi:hypothetical protein
MLALSFAALIYWCGIRGRQGLETEKSGFFSSEKEKKMSLTQLDHE